MKSLEDVVEVIKKYKKIIKHITIYLREPNNTFKYYHHDIDIFFTEHVMINGVWHWGLLENGFGCEKSNAKQTVEDFVEKLRVLGFDFLEATKSYGICTIIKPGDIESMDIVGNELYEVTLKPDKHKLTLFYTDLDLIKRSLENHERYDLLLKL